MMIRPLPPPHHQAPLLHPRPPGRAVGWSPAPHIIGVIKFTAVAVVVEPLVDPSLEIGGVLAVLWEERRVIWPHFVEKLLAHPASKFAPPISFAHLAPNRQIAWRARRRHSAV